MLYNVEYHGYWAEYSTRLGGLFTEFTDLESYKEWHKKEYHYTDDKHFDVVPKISFIEAKEMYGVLQIHTPYINQFLKDMAEDTMEENAMRRGQLAWEANLVVIHERKITDEANS